MNLELEIAEFMRRKGVTRCPTAAAWTTGGTISEADRKALSVRPPVKSHGAAMKERQTRAAQAYANNNVLPAVAKLRNEGCTTADQLSEGLNAADVRTPKGKRWTAAAISAYLEKYTHERPAR